MLGEIGIRIEQVLASQKISSLRLMTIVRLRWVAVLGQVAAVTFVSFGLGFTLPIGYCIAFIALTAWLNVFLQVYFPASHRLTVRFATALLAYDIFQLAGLLYLTGGIENPFAMLIVAPVTVSAASLPLRNTIVLGILAIAAAVILTYNYLPLPWFDGLNFQLPIMYKLGLLAAVTSCMIFLALYAWRLAMESSKMTAALAATEFVLAREQKLHALDGLAAAAAHELGTPLSTITLITKELEKDLQKDSPLLDDVKILREQAMRCREILRKLTRTPDKQDPMHSQLSIRELLVDAAAPYSTGDIAVEVSSEASPEAGPADLEEPVGLRQPGMIFGLGNIIENASDFARTRVDVRAGWDADAVTVEIVDDGPGFSPDMIDTLGEPYVSTRSKGSHKPGGEASGLGLGFFIAKTLLERSGASLSLRNRIAPETGAIVHVVWPRDCFRHAVE